MELQLQGAHMPCTTPAESRIAHGDPSGLGQLICLSWGGMCRRMVLQTHWHFCRMHALFTPTLLVQRRLTAGWPKEGEKQLDTRRHTDDSAGLQIKILVQLPACLRHCKASKCD